MRVGQARAREAITFVVISGLVVIHIAPHTLKRGAPFREWQKERKEDHPLGVYKKTPFKRESSA
jgi:hypothetical protein